MWHLTGQSWLPDCAPVAEALLGVSWGAPCLLPSRVSVSAPFNASWDAIAAKREKSSQNLTQDLPLVPADLLTLEASFHTFGCLSTGQFPCLFLPGIWAGKIVPEGWAGCSLPFHSSSWGHFTGVLCLPLGLPMPKSNDRVVGKDKSHGDEVSRGMIINMSHGERMGKGRRERAGLLPVCAWR